MIEDSAHGRRWLSRSQRENARWDRWGAGHQPSSWVWLRRRRLFAPRILSLVTARFPTLPQKMQKPPARGYGVCHSGPPQMHLKGSAGLSGGGPRQRESSRRGRQWPVGCSNDTRPSPCAPVGSAPPTLTSHSVTLFI